MLQDQRDTRAGFGDSPRGDGQGGGHGGGPVDSDRRNPSGFGDGVWHGASGGDGGGQSDKLFFMCVPCEDPPLVSAILEAQLFGGTA